MAKDRVPELMGVSEVCEELGVTISNLGFVVGLPDPVTEIKGPRKKPLRLWKADEVREFAEGYKARRKERSEAA